MGSVRRLDPNGSLFLDFRDHGKRRRVYTTLSDTQANRKRLQVALERIEREIAAGLFDYEATFTRCNTNPPYALAPRQAKAVQPEQTKVEPATPGPTFKEFAVQWVADHRVEWRRSHLRTLESTLEKWLLPRFAEKRVHEITRSDVFSFRSDLAAAPGRTSRTGLSNKRINGILGPLRQMLNEAADQFGFPSPVATLKPLKVRKTDVQPFSLAEVEQMVATVRDDYRDYLLVRFFTGMRSGEVDGLKWRYIDFTNRLILVRESFVLGADEYTKTDGSQREIQMSTPVHEALRRQEARSRAISEYVFCNREGKPIDNKNFTERVWRPLLRHVGLAVRRPYQMRHTAATLWLGAGESPEWIARQLGHTSTQMLFKVYSRYVPNLTRQDGSAIDRLLRNRFSSRQERAGNE